MSKINILPKRHTNNKIQDIKHLRNLTYLLGKLGIRFFKETTLHISMDSSEYSYEYGLNSYDARNHVESKYLYMIEHYDNYNEDFITRR